MPILNAKEGSFSVERGRLSTEKMTLSMEKRRLSTERARPSTEKSFVFVGRSLFSTKNPSFWREF
jgi:hypothetical protein